MKRILTIGIATTMLFALTGVTPASAHERTAATSLSINVSDSHPEEGDKVRFSGKLSSEWSKCQAFKRVTLKRGHKAVQSTLTDRSGGYSFSQRINSSSNWRVRFTGKRWGVHPHVHRCLPDTSRVIRIRVDD